MKKIILTILTIVSMQLIAQEQKSTIKIYSPDESIKTEKSTGEDTNSYKWTVKTDLLSMITGEFPIIYEHRVTNKISVEGSLGVTYEIMDESLFDSDNDNYKSKPSTGSAFRGGFKYYPSSDWDAIEGWSFGVQAFAITKNRKYTEDEMLLISNNKLEDLDGFKESKVKTGLAVTISKQVFWDSNISYEYLLGIGFANINHNYLEEKFEHSTNKNLYEEKNTTDNKPMIKLGVRIGFGN